MGKFEDSVKEDSSQVLDMKINGVRVRLITGMKDPYYIEVEKDKISEPKEFEKKILESEEIFGSVIFVKDRDADVNYYLYEVYLRYYM